MPAPTALQRRPEEITTAQIEAQTQEDEEVLLEAPSMPTELVESNILTASDTEMTVDAEGGIYNHGSYPYARSNTSHSSSLCTR